MNARLDLDDYQILGTLGVGTVGTIFAALDTVNERRVAIKELHPNVSRDELIRSRFKREMTILSRLQHPNIIRYHGSGDAGGKLFYVMELVEGGSVKELIHSSDQLAWPMVVSISRQICSALQFAHNHGIIHRDLKPANLFLSRSGVVKLGDFGIARDTAAADLTASGLTVGTHAYMAPEQITADGTISGKADLYALGCCMFEMLTGHQPFRGANFAQLFEQHLNATPPSVRDV
ncbi:MAG: serine/threonine-protein kinase, partial [Planctomycetota bacterium]